MDKKIEIRKNEYELWKLMHTTCLILYALAAVAYALIYLNVLPGKTLISVPISSSLITFGYPSLFFVLGYFIHIWSIYKEKKAKQNFKGNTLLPALGLTLSITAVTFVIVVIFSLI